MSSQKDSCCLFIHFICWQKCLVGLSYAILLISIYAIVLLGSQGIFESIMARLGTVTPTVWLQLQHAEHCMSVVCTALRSNLEESLSGLWNHVVLILDPRFTEYSQQLWRHINLKSRHQTGFKIVRSWVRGSTRIRNPKAVAIVSKCNKDAIPMAREFLNCIDPNGQVKIWQVYNHVQHSNNRSFEILGWQTLVIVSKRWWRWKQGHQLTATS